MDESKKKISELLAKAGKADIGTVDIRHRKHPTLPGFVDLQMHATLPAGVHDAFVKGIGLLLKTLAGEDGDVAKINPEHAAEVKQVQEFQLFYDKLPGNVMKEEQ